MKKILALVLAMAMVFSLCACSNKDDNNAGNGDIVNTQPVNENKDDTQPSRGTEPDGQDNDPAGQESEPAGTTGWEIGPVDPSSVITPDLFPANTDRLHMSFSTEFGEGKFAISMATNGVDSITIIESAKGELQTMSKFIDIGGQTYMYTLMSADGMSEEAIYKLSSEAMDSVSDITNVFDNDFIDGLNNGELDSDTFESAEYLGIVDGYHAFKCLANGEYGTIMIDPATGYLAGISMATDEGFMDDEPAVVTVLFSYDVDDSIFDIDVSSAVEDEDGTSVMFVMAQVLLLMDFDGLEDGDINWAEDWEDDWDSDWDADVA